MVEKEYMCVCMTGSFCYTVEIDTTLYINDILIKLKLKKKKLAGHGFGMTAL